MCSRSGAMSQLSTHHLPPVLRRAHSCLLLIALLLVSNGVGRQPQENGYWTALLGLKFTECEEELSLLEGIWRKLVSLFRRHPGVQSAHCESQETHCPSGSAVTGLEVRFGRDEATDRDLYDFKVRCGPIWREWLGMRYPRHPDEEKSDAIRCVDGTVGSGVQVIRGRDDDKDWDYFLFKLRCGLGIATKWTEFTSLPYDWK